MAQISFTGKAWVRKKTGASFLTIPKHLRPFVSDQLVQVTIEPIEDFEIRAKQRSIEANADE